MKKSMYYLAIILFSFISYSGYSQSNEEPEALGLPGDDLNLYAVLDVFQNSTTIEKFEESLNDDNTKINNLDLDNDGKVDFIKVKTEKEGDNFMFVLQVELNKNDVQDVAVVFVNKDKKKEVSIQIVGDENLYGKNYIVEPLESKNATTTINSGYTGSEKVVVPATVSVVRSPVVVYLYSPVYVPYYPPYYYGYYPHYFRPWAPLFFNVYYYNHYHYHNHYYRPPYYRYPSHYNHYYSRRSTSVVVVNNTRNGNYNRTYNGNNYRKPNNPTTRSSTRPNNLSTTPSVRPVSPSKIRPTTSTARPTRTELRPASTARSSDKTARPANMRSSSNQPNTRRSSQRNR